MKSLLRLYGFLRPYWRGSLAALLLLFAMVAADLLIPHLTVDDRPDAGCNRVHAGQGKLRRLVGEVGVTILRRHRGRVDRKSHAADRRIRS